MAELAALSSRPSPKPSSARTENGGGMVGGMYLNHETIGVFGGFNHEQMGGVHSEQLRFYQYKLGLDHEQPGA